MEERGPVQKIEARGTLQQKEKKKNVASEQDDGSEVDIIIRIPPSMGM